MGASLSTIRGDDGMISIVIIKNAIQKVELVRAPIFVDHGRALRNIDKSFFSPVMFGFCLEQNATGLISNLSKTRVIMKKRAPVKFIVQ